MHPMLIESGLFGKGLVKINTLQGVARYNDALAEIGIPATELPEFQIDGIGWSPEIAHERKNTAYLVHGNANQFGIIATPDQYKRPIHMQTNSFDRRVITDFFEVHMREIADCTTTTFVNVEYVTSLIDYETPKDFLMLDQVVVRASTGGLAEVVEEQKELVAEFNAPGPQWFNRDLRAKILASGEKYGDVLNRHTEIPEFKFSLTGNFWTRAFGGVFVLRVGRDSIIVVENDEHLTRIAPSDGERYQAFSLSTKKALLECLIDEGLLEFDAKWWQDNPEEIAKVIDNLIADIVCGAEPNCEYESIKSGRRKSIVLAQKSETGRTISELQRFVALIMQPRSKRTTVELPEELALYLVRPSSKLGQIYQEVLWTLLLRLQENPTDLLKLYTLDKERFFKLFDTWPLSKQKWAVNDISRRYQPQMNQ
jgi:hypothetical protein